MTQPTGTPDWLLSSPSINTPLYNGLYGDATHSSIIFGPYSAVGYTHIAISWNPAEDQFMNITHLDASGAATNPNLNKQIICKANSFARIMVPVLLGQFHIDVHNASGAVNIGGFLLVAAVNGSDRRDAIMGPQNIINVQGVAVAAGGSAAADALQVIEGAATAFLLSNQASAVVTVRVLRSDGATDVISQISNTAANVPVNVPLYIPPRHVHVDVFNESAVAATMFFTLIVGG